MHRAPTRTSHFLAQITGKRLAFVNGRVGVAHHRGQVVGDVAGGVAPASRSARACRPGRSRRPSIRNGRRRRVTSALVSTSPRAVEITTQSRFSIPFSAASSGGISAKPSGLQLGGGGTMRVGMAARMVLGQAVGGDGVGVIAGRRPRGRGCRPGPISWPPGCPAACKAAFSNGRLHRLVVRGQRPVLQPGGHEQRALAVRDHDEGRLPVERVHARRLLRPVRGIVRRFRLVEIGDVVAGPLLLFRIPPDVPLSLRPGLALRVGGSAVVDDAAVGRARRSPSPDGVPGPSGPSGRRERVWL